MGLSQNLVELQQCFQAGDNWGGKSTDLAQWADSPETPVMTLAWDTVTEDSTRSDEVYSVFWKVFLTNLHVSRPQPVGCDPWGLNDLFTGAAYQIFTL